MRTKEILMDRDGHALVKATTHFFKTIYLKGKKTMVQHHSPISKSHTDETDEIRNKDPTPQQ